MNADQLKSIFEKKYNRSAWYDVLKNNFNVTTLLQKPVDITHRIKANDYNAKALELGNFNTTDGHLVGIYELEVANNVQIHRNRKGLRNLLAQVYSNDVEAALLVFIQGSKWRFTYVSEIAVKDKETGKRIKKATDPKRFTYLLGEGERAKTAADRFARIKKTDDLFGGGVTLEALEEAFNVEKMSKAFFNEYRKQYGRFVAHLTGEDENGKKIQEPSAFLSTTFHGNHKAARDFVKKMLGRIVFLYFLEKKGWLGVPAHGKWGDGDENFLSNLFTFCKNKEAFYSNVLVPLFFATLNTERTNDTFHVDGTIFSKPGFDTLKIPYLNGDLFEEDETATQFLVFPQELFQNLFAFFDQYNFTVYEDSPDEHTVAVDPEMLGHIFENLLEDNKDKGAFYTPKEIVHYMCRESLIEYLYTKLNPQATESFKELGQNQTELFGNKAKKQLTLEESVHAPVEKVSREALEKLVLRHEAAAVIEYDEAILKALREVKICDPAIGSGAFPMGLLMEMFHLVETLYEASPDVTAKVWQLQKRWNPAKIKETIIQNSIYGVDIEKGAVDIARLRFWLSLVVDEDTTKPLPNLDYKIVVGNSLLSKFEEEVIEIEWNLTDSHGTDATRKLILEQVGKLLTLQQWQHAYFIQNDNKQKKQQAIRNIKIDILSNQLTLNKISFNEANPRLGGFDPTPKEIEKNLNNELTLASFDNKIRHLKSIKKEQETPLNFFDWRLNFPEVMNNKIAKGNVGFDIIIGNPPYVDIKALPDEEVKLYFKHFETTKNRINLYSIFIEKALLFLTKNGSLSFIIPNSILINSSYQKIRERLINGTKKIIKLPDAIFENAIVETIIFQFANSSNEKFVLAKVYPNHEKTNLLEIEFEKINRELWIEDSEKRFNIFSNEKYSHVLKKIESNAQKLADVADFSLGITPYDKAKGHSKTDIEKRIYHSPKKETKYHVPLISGKNILRYYVSKNSEEYLKYGDWLGAPRQQRFFSEPRIIVRQIVSGKPPRIYAGFTNEELYFTQIGFGIIPKDKNNLKYFLALLNSSLINFYHKYKFLDTEKDLFQKILIANCKEFPIKSPSIEQKKLINKLIDAIINIKVRDVQKDTFLEEKEIDILIYKIYGLTWQEASIIEGSATWMSKDEYENIKQ